MLGSRRSRTGDIAMTRPILAALPVLAGLAILSSCARTMAEPAATPELLAAPAGAPQCFLPSQINGYSAAPEGPRGEDRFLVHTGARDRWLFETAGACAELGFSQRIALDTRFNGTRLCAGETAMVLVPRGPSGPPDRCNARLLGKLAPR